MLTRIFGNTDEIYVSSSPNVEVKNTINVRSTTEKDRLLPPRVKNQKRLALVSPQERDS